MPGPNPGPVDLVSTARVTVNRAVPNPSSGPGMNKPIKVRRAMPGNLTPGASVNKPIQKKSEEREGNTG